jgi:hypothetical protein
MRAQRNISPVSRTDFRLFRRVYFTVGGSPARLDALWLNLRPRRGGNHAA